MQWRAQVQTFGVALAFMTRFGVARCVDDIVLARALAWFVPVGVVVALGCAVPVYIMHCIVSVSPWILAWLYILLEIWISRALHYDGLADISDAWGSGAQGQEFWRIVHDSRLGAFGALALFLILSGMLCATQSCIITSAWWNIFLAPVFGRSFCVIFASFVPAYAAHSLGGKMIAGASKALGYTHIGIALCLALCLGYTSALCVFALSLLCFLCLARLAHAQGGSNGDFLGTSIVVGQCIFLLAG